MIRNKYFVIMTIFLFAILLTACLDSSSNNEKTLSEIPEVSEMPDLPSLLLCGEEVFSKEDEDGFMEKYFEYINLYDAEEGGSFEKDNSNVYLVKSDQFIGISYKSVFPNHLRLCIQEYDGDGKVVLDRTIYTDGGGSWSLQPFEPGIYVFRMIVKNMVMKSFVINVSD